MQVVSTEVNDPYKSLTATPQLLASVLAVVLLTFFFMVYGENLQRNAIALLPDAAAEEAHRGHPAVDRARDLALRADHQRHQRRWSA